MRRALLGALAGLGLLAPGAAGATDFKPCAGASGVQCATLTVPIDRTGAVPGTVPLHVTRVAATHPTRAPIVLITGGPGQGGQVLAGDGIAGGPFDANALGRDVIAFDPRGTGESGLLRCPALEKAIIGLDTDAAATECWNTLGAARYDYTSRTVADDIEAIRVAVGAPKIALYGISYGTSEAQTYARVYPQNVDRLILDSVVPPGGGDGLERQSFAAIPRVLRAVCSGRRCAGVTSDPVADLAKLISTMPAGGLVGPVITNAGHRARQRAGRYELFDLVVNGDFDPTLRGSLPGAVRSALAGDNAPLLRLVRASLLSDVQDFNHPADLSTADFAATVCQEAPFPWPRTGSIDQRRTALAAAVAAIPPASITPFDQPTLLAPQIVAPCLAWPTSAQPPDLGAANPDVPVLILSGEADLRTPTEGAETAAAGFPQAILRTYPYAGHDIIDGIPGQPCAWAQAREFLSGAAVGECTGHEQAPPVAPVAPRTLAAVTPLRPGGKAGRALHAVALTIDDFFLSPGTSIVPGLRGGRALVGATELLFEHDSYVPGLTVNGHLKPKKGKLSGTLRVAGAVTGTLRFTANRVAGRLGGHRVRARLKITSDHVLAVPAKAAAASLRWRPRTKGSDPFVRVRFPRPR